MKQENPGESPASEPKNEGSPQAPIARSAPPQSELAEHASRSTKEASQQTQELAREFRIVEIIQIAISGVLAITGVFVLWVYWGQLREMRKSTDAATKAANTSRDALTKGQRAFIYFSHTIAPTAVVPDPKTMRITNWEFSVPFGNSGETPTRRASMHVNVYASKQALPDNFGFPEIGAFIKQLITVGPKEQTATGRLITTSDKIKAVQDGKGHLYLYGWCTYKDVFQDPGDIPHVTKFCYELDNWGGNPFSALGLPVRNSSFWVSCPQHNCTDEECKDEKYASPP
ncbi:MAG: hypothetical protein ACLQOO_18565 [Terriglobia bacterium]